MANRRATLVRSLKLDGKWRYCSPFVSTKGRKEKPTISPDYVVLRGKKFLVPMLVTPRVSGVLSSLLPFVAAASAFDDPLWPEYPPAEVCLAQLGYAGQCRPT